MTQEEYIAALAREIDSNRQRQDEYEGCDNYGRPAPAHLHGLKLMMNQAVALEAHLRAVEAVEATALYHEDRLNPQVLAELETARERLRQGIDLTRSVIKYFNGGYDEFEGENAPNGRPLVNVPGQTDPRPLEEGESK